MVAQNYPDKLALLLTNNYPIIKRQGTHKQMLNNIEIKYYHMLF